MKATDLRFLAAACNGRLLGGADISITNVVIDSRQAAEGSLFVCITGEKNDGHNYWQKAYEQGCRAFLMSRPDIAGEAAKLAVVVFCDDCEKAFAQMAGAYLDQFDLIKVGVTGSVGKTSTKMLTAAVLSSKYNTVCTQKNLNTQLGLCLTCFLAGDSTQAIVFEMGMDRKGEIEEYCRWVRPDAALITMIGVSHLERLGTRDAICDAKLEITKYLKDDAPLFYNEDGEFLFEEEIRRRTTGGFACKPVLGEGGEYKLTDAVSLGAEGISFTLEGKKEVQKIDLPLLGVHNAMNAALACALGEYYGISLKAASEALGKVTATEGRLKAEKVGGIYLIDDSYNAAPDSMVAGIEVLSDIDAQRRFAVLSDMLELGSNDEEGHKRVGRRAAELGIDFLFFVGNKKKLYCEGVNEIGFKGEYIGMFDSPDEAWNVLSGVLESGDAVLVKGSNATKISEVAKAIKKEFN